MTRFLHYPKLRMSRLAPLVLLLALSCSACSGGRSDFGPGGSGSVAPSDLDSGWERAAQTVFGTLEDVQFEHNDTGEYVLAMHPQPTTRRNPDPVVNYLVYDLAEETTTVQEQVTGQVQWWGPRHILVQTVPGDVSGNPRVDDRTYNYTVDVETGIRTRGSQIGG